MPDYDVLIIGSGITGASVAYQLSRYHVRAAVLEKENDVAMGTTRANSAIVHAGYDPEPGTRMARYNVEGNRLVEEICGNLDVPYRKCGSLVLAFNEEDERMLAVLLQRGQENGVPGLEIRSGDAVRRMEPHVSREVRAALYAPTGGIVSPWELTLAMMEIAVKNGVSFFRNSMVTGIERLEGNSGYRVLAGDKVFTARFIVNAAGLYADMVHDMAAPHAFTIYPNRGQYYLLDKSAGDFVSHVIFQCPSAVGKGVLISPTVHGNLIVGPDSVPVEERENTATTAAGLEEIARVARRSCPDINISQSIRNFSGVRAATEIDDFIVRQPLPGFFILAGIKSPGLTSAPAMAVDTLRLMREAGLSFVPKPDWSNRRRIVRFSHLSPDGKTAQIQTNPLYGRIICRCETVTEGEIVDALHSVIPPVSVDGVKRRVNAGMGRCQGGFCGPRVVDIIARELGIPHQEVVQNKAGSYILAGETKKGGERSEAI